MYCKRHQWAICLCLATLLLILRFGHLVTCFFHIDVCTPLLPNLLHRLSPFYLDARPDPWPARSTDAAAGICRRFAHETQWVVLLSSQASGSTWVRDTMKYHPHFAMRSEMLIENARECRGEARNATGCTWEAVEALLNEAMYARGRAPPREATHVGFKLMFDHLQGHLRDAFVHWVTCNDVTVVHLYRRNVLASFASLQRRLLGSERLYLEPSVASDFVRTVEEQRAHFQRELQGVANYYEISYEDLALGRSAPHWAALTAFLGLKRPLRPRDTTPLRVNRSCAHDVLNWAAVEPLLRGTATHVACAG